MNLDQLVFAGFNRRVAALDRQTGTIVWQWKAPKGNCYVSLLLDQNVLIVSVDGYLFGLDAVSGNELWYNPMKNFGSGVTSLVSRHGQSFSPVLAAASSAASSASQQMTQQQLRSQ
jgi:hypothetical protein